MAAIKKFEDLIAWQKARQLCRLVHTYTRRPEFSKDYKFRDQLRSSAGSVMDNIAEGFGRKGNPEFKNFLAIANGSLMESKYQLFRAFDQGYIQDNELRESLEMIDETARIIHALIIYLGRSDYRGIKFSETECSTGQESTTPRTVNFEL
jgi:four helix bundle protein